MTDREKVEHLEEWIKGLIDHASRPATGNVMIDQARIDSIVFGLNQAINYKRFDT